MSANRKGWMHHPLIYASVFLFFMLGVTGPRACQKARLAGVLSGAERVDGKVKERLVHQVLRHTQYFLMRRSNSLMDICSLAVETQYGPQYPQIDCFLKEEFSPGQDIRLLRSNDIYVVEGKPYRRYEWDVMFVVLEFMAFCYFLREYYVKRFGKGYDQTSSPEP